MLILLPIKILMVGNPAELLEREVPKRATNCLLRSE
jgi:hypothetical protein